jgi:hypothetical protein
MFCRSAARTRNPLYMKPVHSCRAHWVNKFGNSSWMYPSCQKAFKFSLDEECMQNTLCVSKITIALTCEICPGFMFLSVLVGMLPSSEWFLMCLLSS